MAKTAKIFLVQPVPAYTGASATVPNNKYWIAYSTGDGHVKINNDSTKVFSVSAGGNAMVFPSGTIVNIMPEANADFALTGFEYDN